MIPAYDEEKYLAACLTQIKKCETDDYEIVVVDAGSEDGTVGIARKYGCRVVMGRKNGVGDARNAGAKSSKGGIVAFLDADSMPYQGWLDVIESEFKKHGNAVAVGGPTDYGQARYFIAQHPFWLNHITKHFGFFFLSGNNAAYKRDFFLKVGGFRPICCEETEFALRIGKHRNNMIFSERMRVRLSPRRFKQQGFYRTLFRWFILDLKIFLGIFEPGARYGGEIGK